MSKLEISVQAKSGSYAGTSSVGTVTFGAGVNAGFQYVNIKVKTQDFAREPVEASLSIPLENFKQVAKVIGMIDE